MKLFLREHIPLIFFSIIQVFLVVLLIWLDGYRHLSIIFYAFFLGLCLLLAYLAFRYMTHRRMYQTLSEPTNALTDAIQQLEHTPLSEALNELLDSQYRHYYNQMKTWERKQQNHLTFMNQWVHQMKTPLSVIELITQEDEDDRLASISAEADQMRKGLEMVLYMARLETFEQDFRVDHIALREIIHEVIQENKRLFIRNLVYPEVHVDEAVTVESDAKWLKFILQQLLFNAVKYSAGSEQKIVVTSSSEGRTVILEVKDHGIGIPKTDVSRVFQPFFTGENGRKYKESTGMGLYLVKEVIDKLGHTINLQSRPGRGTTVRIKFLYATH